jgi:hypothetical protein
MKTEYILLAKALTSLGLYFANLAKRDDPGDAEIESLADECNHAVSEAQALIEGQND